MCSQTGCTQCALGQIPYKEHYFYCFLSSLRPLAVCLNQIFFLYCPVHWRKGMVCMWLHHKIKPVKNSPVTKILCKKSNSILLVKKKKVALGMHWIQGVNNNNPLCRRLCHTTSKFMLKWFQNTEQHGNAGKNKGRVKISLGRASWLGRDAFSLPVMFSVFRYYSQTLKFSSLTLSETKLQQGTVRKTRLHTYIYRVSNREGER